MLLPGIRSKLWCVPGMGMILWGASPLNIIRKEAILATLKSTSRHPFHWIETLHRFPVTRHYLKQPDLTGNNPGAASNYFVVKFQARINPATSGNVPQMQTANRPLRVLSG
jgi:hypothetical protein